MTRQSTTLAVVSTLCTLMGCAPLSNSTSPVLRATGAPARDALPVKVAAVSAGAQLGAAPSAQSAYLMGRAAHGAGHLGEARAHYAQVLELEPRHVGALNALAVIHAQEGRLDEALKLFGEAMALAPQAAHLHNNAGYALLRAGRLGEAETALLRARDLEPTNQQTVQNLTLLRTAQAKAGDGIRGPTPQAQGDKPTAGPRLVAVAPQVYALQPGASAEAHVSMPATVLAAAAALPVTTVAPVAKPLRGVRVEVSNGVGISRLARRTADRLAPTGLVAARLTNAKPYRQATTEIQFASDQENMAQLLRSYLPVNVKAVAVTQLQPGIQIRIVLGRDLTGKAVAAWLDEAAQELQATSTKDDGWSWG